MKNVILTILLVISVVWAYDWYLKSNYVLIAKTDCELMENQWIDPGFGVPVPTVSLPAVTASPHDTEINCYKDVLVQEPLKVDNSCTFRSGGKEYKMTWDNEKEVWWITEVGDDSIVDRQNWPNCGLIPPTGWWVNLCVGDDVIYTFR